MIEALQPYLQEIWKGSGFDEPTPVQKQAYPIIHDGKDIIAVSPTGSGKTIAYLLPLLEKIDENKKQAQLMILASSHELAAQLHRIVQEWTVNSGITSMLMIGGANIKRQIEKLKKKPQIIVGTPGRVLELIQQKKLKVHELAAIVFDEADQLFVTEHRPHLFGIMKAAPKEKQVVLCSATISEGLSEEAKSFMNEPKVVRIDSTEAGTPAVSYQYVVCEARDKVEVLRSLARNGKDQMLVFFRDIGNLAVMADKLTYIGLSVEGLHGDLPKQKREQAIREFKKKETQLLLATDVAARGLDVKNLSFIIQMDVPKEADQYLHRAGRTGRLGSEGGTVLSLVTTEEARKLKQLSTILNIEIEEMRLREGRLIRKR